MNIEQLIKIQNTKILDMEIAPDDDELLLTLGNYDVFQKDYSIDILNRAIWKFNPSNNSIERITAEDEDAHSPTWSPDGNLISYISKENKGPQLWIMSKNGVDKKQATFCDFPCKNPFYSPNTCWSSDGKNIAYTVYPNGGIAELRQTISNSAKWSYKYRDNNEGIVVHGPNTYKERDNLIKNNPSYICSIYIYNLDSKNSRKLMDLSHNNIRLLKYTKNDTNLIVKTDTELFRINVITGQINKLYVGQLNLIKILNDEDIYAARIEKPYIEVGKIINNEFNSVSSVEMINNRLRLHIFSNNATKIYGTYQEGVTNYLCSLDILTAKTDIITEKGKVVMNKETSSCAPVSFNKNKSILFTYESPAEPISIWKLNSNHEITKMRDIVKLSEPEKLPKVKVIKYISKGRPIEALLVLPFDYKEGTRYPTLVYLHGGPESCVSASFGELNSARAQSASYFLASNGYVILIPNFRGSSGYGEKFEKEIGNYQLMNKPYEDIMAGIKFVIDKGIADPDKLGIYGSSFGGWLTTWTISHSNIFKGAVSGLGFYDILYHDRVAGAPFVTLRPNRQENTDKKDIWLRPNLYNNISPINYISNIHTPLLMIETGAERYLYDGRMLFNGLCALKIEAYLAYYPDAFHTGGWNDEYKKDYMLRILAWFNHCIKNFELPDWFND